MKLKSVPDTDKVMTSLKSRFFSRIEPVPEAGCWLWAGRWNHEGYGGLKIKKQYHSAHRVSWMLHHGPIPDDMGVLHRCDVRSCVNPSHLFLGTHQDNMDDMMQKGRRNPYGKSRLKPEDIEAIRQHHTLSTPRELAEKYNVHQSTIKRVIKSTTWKAVQNEERPR